MTWNRDLDQVEAKALHDLKEIGYKSVDKKHIIHFKEIYDFICRFADPQYSGNVILTMTSGPVPRKTLGIVRNIGAENLYKYFSMDVYPEKFFHFCQRLIRTRHISSHDYLAEGEIVVKPIKAIEIEYEG